MALINCLRRRQDAGWGILRESDDPAVRPSLGLGADLRLLLRAPGT